MQCCAGAIDVRAIREEERYVADVEVKSRAMTGSAAGGGEQTARRPHSEDAMPGHKTYVAMGEAATPGAVKSKCSDQYVQGHWQRRGRSPTPRATHEGAVSHTGTGAEQLVIGTHPCGGADLSENRTSSILRSEG